MTNSDDENDLLRWVRIFNKSKGYGGVFNHENSSDKAIVEISTARDWCNSISAEFGYSFGEPRHNADDPPDCYVDFEGRQLGIELVQLIEQDHKHRASKDETPYAGQLYKDMQWSCDRLGASLCEIIAKKGKKYLKCEVQIDVLVIHTAELWLTSEQVNKWLKDIQIQEHSNITSAYLLMDYEPGRGVRHWPVFRLYDNLLNTTTNGR